MTGGRSNSKSCARLLDNRLTNPGKTRPSSSFDSRRHRRRSTLESLLAAMKNGPYPATGEPIYGQQSMAVSGQALRRSSFPNWTPADTFTRAESPPCLCPCGNADPFELPCPDLALFLAATGHLGRMWDDCWHRFDGGPAAPTSRHPISSATSQTRNSAGSRRLKGAFRLTVSGQLQWP